MANEFVIKNGFVSNNSSQVQGALTATTYYGDGSNLTGIVASNFGGGSITGATSFGSRVTGVVVPLTFSSTTTTDLSLGNEFTLTLTGSTTIANPINATIDGQLFKYVIRQNSVGGYTVSFSGKFRYGTEIGLPVIDSNPNKTSYIGVRYNQTDDRFDIIAFVSGY